MVRAALRLGFCLLGAPLAWAQGPTLGLNLHMALSTGPLNQDVNQHPGFGMGITVPVPVGPGIILRPNAEMTGTRVTAYNPVGWLYNQDPKDVFRTYKGGLDLQVYPAGDQNHGGYLFAGAGVQWSMLDLDQPTENGSQTYATYHRRAGAWFGGGFGFQFNAASALEVRLSTFQYRAPQGLPLDTLTPGPSEDRTATQIHLILALRIPGEGLGSR